MPKYTVTDPTTGQKLTLTGDSPPTEAELNEIFASTKQVKLSGPQVQAEGEQLPESTDAWAGDPSAPGGSKKIMGQTLQAPADPYSGLKDFGRNSLTAIGAGLGGVAGFATPVPGGLAAGTLLGGGAGKLLGNAIFGEAQPEAPKVNPAAGQGFSANAIEMAKNVPSSAANTVMGGIGMMGDLSKAQADVLTGVNPQAGQQTLQGLVDMVKNLGRGDEWVTNPVGNLATLGLLVEPAIKTGKAIARPPLKLSEGLANKLTDMTLKQGTTLKPSIRKQNVQTALEGGYIPNEKGVDKLNKDTRAIENKLSEGIQASDAANVQGTLDKAISNIEALRGEADRSSNPERNNALIDAEIERLSNNPMVNDTGGIPAGDLQKMKVEQQRTVKYQEKTGQAPDAFQATIDKARIRGMKEELETKVFDVFPELSNTNKQLGKQYQLSDVLERAASRIQNNQGIGIGLPIKSGAGAGLGSAFGTEGAVIGGVIGTMVGIIEHPSVAPRLAQMLYKANKGAISMNEAMKVTKDRLSKIVEGIQTKLGNPKP